MPQEFHVVRCFKCEAFQVHIVKKIPKWECKICGEKQSVRQVYGKGTGKDCRLHVQKLNALRAEEIPENIDEDDEEFGNQNSSITEITDTTTLPSNDQPKKSKWAEFLDDETENNEDNNVDENIYPSSKKLKLLETNTCSEFRNRNHEKTDFRIQNQKTLRSYFESDTKLNRKSYTADVIPIQSKNSILPPSFSTVSSCNEQNKSQHNFIDQIQRNNIFESFKKTDNTLSQNINTENKSTDSLKNLKPSNSKNTPNQLYKKTVFESFQDNDNLDSILDTNF